MKQLKALLLLVIAVCFAAPAVAQQQIPEFPMDPAIRYGKLPNGLTYYIRHNEEPKERVNFYIAQKVGAIQEEDSQRGLAHFLEHMCFNGTKNFPGNGVIAFCERIGVKFGQNLNAYTATDETVYNIDDVPSTVKTNIDSCLLILHDWSDGLLLETEEIDKERGVIHEEWRMRSSASQRMFERSLPMLYPGSRYGYRMPIGTMEVIDNFKPEELRAYYEKWYRPDFQGVIVVGDIDVDYVEAKIKEIFADIQMPENPVDYEFYPVPDNEEAIYVIDKDKEMQQNVIQIMYKQEALPFEYHGTPIKMQMDYITSMACSVLNARLGELAQKPDCPFLGAGADYGKFILSKTCDALEMSIVPKPGKDIEAVQAVMQEVERASRFGFTGTELYRAKEEAISRYERVYENRNKQRNNYYTKQYVRHFLEGDYIPDIETEFETYKQMSQMIPAEAISQVFHKMTESTEKNFVVLGMYTDKPEVTIPTVDQLKGAIAAAKAAKLEAYVDNVKDEPLIKKLPKAGKILKETPAEFGYTRWTLSNGANVYFKQTDFSDTEISMQAMSKGGTNKFSDEDFLNGDFVSAVIGSQGIGNFTAVELEKKLAGKQCNVVPSLGQYTDNLVGSSTPKDLRTFFELLYLRFQEPANDPDAYNNFIASMRSALENAEKDPQTAFSDSLRSTLYNHHPRFKSMKLADIDKLNYETIKRLYRQRYQSAGDFDFFFTGAINVDSLRAFTTKYLAALPGCKKREELTDLNIRLTKGDIQNRFSREMETPQANIVQLWHGDLAFTPKNRVILDALGEILSQRYLKSIREEGGMAYSVGADGSVSTGVRDEYMVQIYCPVQPAKMDSALYLMELGINEIAEGGVTADELGKWREFEVKNYNDMQRRNGYWSGLITNKVFWGKDSQEGYLDAINALKSEDIQDFVKNVFLRQKNRAIVTMLPTDFTE